MTYVFVSENPFFAPNQLPDISFKLDNSEGMVIKLNKQFMFGVILTAVISMAVSYIFVSKQKKFEKDLLSTITELSKQNKELQEKIKKPIHDPKFLFQEEIESMDERILRKCIEVIHSNISDPTFGVEKMARAMAMSRTSLHRKIKALSGLPPSELIRTTRLKKAAALLLGRNNSVSQISLVVGFDDHSYFSKAFKKEFGILPSEYFESQSKLAQAVSSLNFTQEI